MFVKFHYDYFEIATGAMHPRNDNKRGENSNGAINTNFRFTDGGAFGWESFDEYFCYV